MYIIIIIIVIVIINTAINDIDRYLIVWRARECASHTHARPSRLAAFILYTIKSIEFKIVKKLGVPSGSFKMHHIFKMLFPFNRFFNLFLNHSISLSPQIFLSVSVILLANLLKMLRQTTTYLKKAAAKTKSSYKYFIDFRSFVFQS